jgi:hypothetical protein
MTFAAGRVEVRANGVNRLAAAFVLLAIVVFWAAALYGIRSPFYYGHYGYHGGSYATWARGTLRHHTLLPVNEPGFAPPRAGSYYIHHPILTHQLVTLTFVLFGEHEWSIRLAALIPAFASLLLVTAIAWRKLGPPAGAMAALTFAVVPVNIWYSVNIDQGFPSIACLLAFFWFYLGWLETGRWSWAWAALAFEALAGGFEWSPYFAFPAIFAHVAWTALRRRGRYLGFGLIHPLVVLVPLAAHVWAVSKSGMMSDLAAAYRNRAAEVAYSHFLRGMGEYGDTLYGRPLLAVMFIWLVWTIVRVARKRGRPVDLVGLTFAFALITYVHVFKVAVLTHAYRQLYGNVWAALAVADLASQLGAWARSFMVRRVRQTGVAAGRVGLAVSAFLALGALAAIAPTAWAGLTESRAHGGIPGWKTFNPDLRQSVFAREVNRSTRPGDIIFFHGSFANPPPTRMDWAFYYDRDLSRGALLRVLQGLPPADRERAVVLVVPASLGPDELRAYAELSRGHSRLIVSDLVMLDLRSGRTTTRAFRLESQGDARPHGIARWLDGPYPWPRLLPDPARQAADDALVQSTLAIPRAAPAAAGVRVAVPSGDRRTKLNPVNERRRHNPQPQTR